MNYVEDGGSGLNNEDIAGQNGTIMILSDLLEVDLGSQMNCDLFYCNFA